MPELHLVCGRCGVPASTLMTFTCPGCGADVREVGIGQRAGGRGPARLIVFWTVLIAIIVGTALMMLEIFPYHSVHQQRGLVPENRLTAPEVTITAAGTGFSKNCPLDDVTMLLVTPAGRTLVRVDAASLAYATLDERLNLVERPGRLTHGVMLVILSSIGFDPTDPATRQAATELMGFIAAAHAGNMDIAARESFPTGEFGGGRVEILNRALINWTWFAGLVLWAAGVAFIFHRQRRIRISPITGEA